MSQECLNTFSILFSTLVSPLYTQLIVIRAGPDAMDMKSKVLSLELIQMILESSGPAFCHSERFVNSAIKKYLCASLLLNGVSPVPRVFKLSLSIFLALMSTFRENLKAEIGVFFSKIFLWILENNNSTIQQKWMVLQVLYQICKNPQTLVDIFVNYDCDPEAKDIFERLVSFDFLWSYN
jgi:brefeldin A-inhibited guanine nucleotide-exchange protein